MFELRIRSGDQQLTDSRFLKRALKSALTAFKKYLEMECGLTNPEASQVEAWFQEAGEQFVVHLSYRIRLSTRYIEFDYTIRPSDLLQEDG
jgi:hypothetical protein